MKILNMSVVVLLWLLLLAGNSEAAMKASFDFTHADIHTVLRVFAKETGLNIVAAREVSGNITAKMNNTEPLQALDMVLKANGYQYLNDRGTIFVSPSKNGKLDIRSYSLQYVDVDTARKAISEMINATDGERMSVSPSLNMLTIQGGAEKLDQLSKVIQKLDTPPLQVLVEVKIIEVKSGLGDNDTPSFFGVSLDYISPTNTANRVQLHNTNLATAPGLLGLYSQLTYQNTTLYLQALERTVGYNLVASPWITAMNHHESSILIGTKLGYRTSIVTQTGTLEEIHFMNVGIKLNFTPHISDDGYVQMTIYPSVSDGQIINELPVENATETRTDVLVKDGQSVVIGGLTKNSDTQISTGLPILSAIPFLGQFFQKTENRTEKREIIVVLTPHIMTPALLESMEKKSRDLEAKAIK